MPSRKKKKQNLTPNEDMYPLTRLHHSRGVLLISTITKNSLNVTICGTFPCSIITIYLLKVFDLSWSCALYVICSVELDNLSLLSPIKQFPIKVVFVMQSSWLATVYLFTHHNPNKSLKEKKVPHSSLDWWKAFWF